MELQQKMFKLVEEWKLSNLTKGEFSTQQKVTYHSLNYWIKKYNKVQTTLESNSISDENTLSFFSLPESTKLSKSKIKNKAVNNLSKRMDIELGNGIKITIY